MRLFVAVYPSGAALDHLAELICRLRLGAAAAAGTNVRLAGRSLWHVTLVFLGEVPDDRAPVAADAVRAGVTDWQAGAATGKAAAATRQAGAAIGRPGAAAAPVLRLAGGGRFGRGRGSVVWVGLAGGVEPLYQLTRSVRRSLRRARCTFDRKPFRPHLTIARPGDRLPPAELAADVATLAEYAGPDWPVEQLQLVRSVTGPKPVHEPLASVRLG